MGMNEWNEMEINEQQNISRPLHTLKKKKKKPVLLQGLPCQTQNSSFASKKDVVPSFPAGSRLFLDVSSTPR